MNIKVLQGYKLAEIFPRIPVQVVGVFYNPLLVFEIIPTLKQWSAAKFLSHAVKTLSAYLPNPVKLLIRAQKILARDLKCFKNEIKVLQDVVALSSLRMADFLIST